MKAKLLITEVANGFTVEYKFPPGQELGHYDQELKKDGMNVFNSLDDAVSFLYDHYGYDKCEHDIDRRNDLCSVCDNEEEKRKELL